MNSRGIAPGAAVISLEGCTPSEFVKGIEPHFRRLVVAVEEDVVDLFDIAFAEGALAEVSALPSGDAQEAGIKGFAMAVLLPFTINIAATMAMDRLKLAFPETMAGTAAPPAVEARPALPFLGEAISRSALPQAQKDAALDFLSRDDALKQALQGVAIIMKHDVQATKTR
jgi:hypothetical protein